MSAQARRRAGRPPRRSGRWEDLVETGDLKTLRMRSWLLTMRSEPFCPRTSLSRPTRTPKPVESMKVTSSRSTTRSVRPAATCLSSARAGAARCRRRSRRRHARSSARPWSLVETERSRAPSSFMPPPTRAERRPDCRGLPYRHVALHRHPRAGRARSTSRQPWPLWLPAAGANGSCTCTRCSPARPRRRRGRSGSTPPCMPRSPAPGSVSCGATSSSALTSPTGGLTS